jgi:hypothetical protein
MRGAATWFRGVRDMKPVVYVRCCRLLWYFEAELKGSEIFTQCCKSSLPLLGFKCK